MAKDSKIDHNKVSRVWNEGGPKIENVTIGLLHDIKDDRVVLQFSDQLGPVFKAIFDRPALREVLDYLYDALLEIDLDEAEKARKADKMKDFDHFMELEEKKTARANDESKKT